MYQRIKNGFCPFTFLLFRFCLSEPCICINGRVVGKMGVSHKYLGGAAQGKTDYVFRCMFENCGGTAHICITIKVFRL